MQIDPSNVDPSFAVRLELRMIESKLPPGLSALEEKFHKNKLHESLCNLLVDDDLLDCTLEGKDNGETKVSKQ